MIIMMASQELRALRFTAYPPLYLVSSHSLTNELVMRCGNVSELLYETVERLRVTLGTERGVVIFRWDKNAQCVELIACTFFDIARN